MAVVVPPGCGPGSHVAVETPTGELVTVEVPPGVTEGQELQFALPDASAPPPPPPPPPPAAAPVDPATAQMNLMMTSMEMAGKYPQATQQVVTAAPKVLAASEKVVERAKTADPEGNGSASHGLQVMAGAGAVGGVAVGAVTGSVLVGVAAAGGAAYAATRSDKIGEMGKATGRAAIAGYAKAKQVNEEHQLTTRAKALVVTSYTKAKELDEKHHILSRAKAAASAGMSKAKAFDEKHDVSGKVASGVVSGMNALTNRLGGSAAPAATASAAAGAPPPPPPPPPPPL